MYSVYLTDYNSTPTADTATPTRKKLYIYDPITHDEGLIATEPTLSVEVNKSGSFSCTIPETNYGYGRIIKGLTRVVVEKNNKIIFMGRVNEEDRDLYLNQKIIAEGALAYLNDTLTDKKTFTSETTSGDDEPTLPKLINYIFNKHNSKFTNEPWKQFHLVVCEAQFVGRDNKSATSNRLTQYNLNFDNSMEVVIELVDLANGALKYEYNEENGWWDVYIYDKYNLPISSNQPIEFGLNLLDLVQSYSFNNIATVVAPFGGDLIQTSKEIGDVVAGPNNLDYVEEALVEQEPGVWVKDIYNHSLWRYGSDPNYNYDIYPAEAGTEGYWAFAFDIGAYNNAHPNNHIKRLYLSWRAYKFTTENDYIADNSWRIYERIWDETLQAYVYQTLGFKELTNDNGEFESAINEVIDLTDPQYKGANWIRMGGWGGLITPLIRRDAIVVESNDKLSIEPCRTFEHEDGLTHPANDKFYLYSDELINKYGRIEKKLEYDINDENKPLTSYHGPIIGDLGNISKYEGWALGYQVEYDEEQNPNFEKNKGKYILVQLANDSPYCCYEYVLPDLGSSYRPRGVFVTSRMHDIGVVPYNGNDWQVDGMYVLLDESEQVLSYKTAAKSDKGFGFTNIQREYIDLSEAQNFGAKKIRVGGYVGGNFTVELYPSDDTYSANLLMDQAKLYLTSSQWEKVTIEATAVDLSMTSKEWDSLDICTRVPVLSKYHGVNSTMPLTALELQLDSFENNSIKLGYDNDEYLSYQLSESLRLMTVSKEIEERSKSQ